MIPEIFSVPEQPGDIDNPVRLVISAGMPPDLWTEYQRRFGVRICEIYGSTDISERHRHRYEVNVDYKDRLESCGLVFSGMSPDGLLPETVEYPDHPWFIGVQYHPELKSRPLDPHPLFASFIGAALEQSRLV